MPGCASRPVLFHIRPLYPLQLVISICNCLYPWVGVISLKSTWSGLGTWVVSWLSRSLPPSQNPCANYLNSQTNILSNTTYVYFFLYEYRIWFVFKRNLHLLAFSMSRLQLKQERRIGMIGVTDTLAMNASSRKVRSLQLSIHVVGKGRDGNSCFCDVTGLKSR